VTVATGSPRSLTAVELNSRLAAERLRRGRGLVRRGDRRVWRAPLDTLPDGTVIVDDRGEAQLVLAGHLRPFGFRGWGEPLDGGLRPVDVLTPPTSVAALRNGYEPVLHPSAGTSLPSRKVCATKS